MWLAAPLIIVLALVVIGGLVAGGLYAAILIPIVAIVVIVASIMSLWRRANAPRGTIGEHEVAPLPQQPGHNASAAPATPADLADARRSAQ